MAEGLADNLSLLRFNTTEEYKLPLPDGWTVQISPPIDRLNWWDLYVYNQSGNCIYARVKLDTFEAQCVLMALMNNPQEVTREQE
jgi:hypothetical protein